MKNIYIYRQLCILLLLIFIIPCYGQINPHSPMHWRDTISYENQFHGGIRDKAGNLWFATTDKGVYRYDVASNGFTNFTEKDGLCNNNVAFILEDKAGNIWFSTDKGVCRYNGKLFTNITTKGGPYNMNVWGIAEDNIGNLWFGTQYNGVFRYNPSSDVFTNFTTEQGLSSNAVQCILKDKAGNLWFGERAGGVCRYDTASSRFAKVDGDGCFSDQIMGIVEDKTGNIWFANLYEGLCRYDGKSFTHFSVEDGMCNNFVTCIYADKKGNLWFGSDPGKWRRDGGGPDEGGGVCRYDGKSFTRFTTKDGISTSHLAVWTIVEDNAGNIWIGCKGGGLYRYDGKSFANFTGTVNR
jgi:ligand-binding sensor domain-containing protein